MNRNRTALGWIALLGLIVGAALLLLGSAQQAAFAASAAATSIGFGTILLVVGGVAGLAWLVVGAVRRD